MADHLTRLVGLSVVVTDSYDDNDEDGGRYRGAIALDDNIVFECRGWARDKAEHAENTVEAFVDRLREVLSL